MKKKPNINFISIARILYIKIKNLNVVNLFIYLFKIKSSISLIIKFILLFMALLANTNDFTSIWDSGDLLIRMVEQESNNVKMESTNDTALQTPELIKESKEIKEEIDIESMDMDEWLDYLREHDPKAYWFWIAAFCATSVFCVWLMHYLIGPGFPPKESL